MRISVRRLIRRRLSVFTNFLPSSYRANVVYPTSYPSPNSAVEPSDDISHSYVDDADLNIAQPVNSFGDQESTSQYSNSELATFIRESTVHRLREEMVAVGGGHALMEEDSNGGGPEGEKGINMHDSLVVETGVRYQCSGTIRSFNACVEFRDTDLPLVLEEMMVVVVVMVVVVMMVVVVTMVVMVMVVMVVVMVVVVMVVVMVMMLLLESAPPVRMTWKKNQMKRTKLYIYSN